MIRVTIELISAISITRNKTLGVVLIGNIGTTGTNPNLCNYFVKLSKWAPKLNESWTRGFVKDFNRVKRGPYDLLYLALQSCLGKRNGDHLTIEQLEETEKQAEVELLATLPSEEKKDIS